MQKEIYNDIPGYEGLYQVSNYGNVKSLSKLVNGKSNIKRNVQGKQMSLVLRGDYFEICLCKQGKRKLYRVHQLVAMAFLGHIPDGYKLVIDHIDNNKLNNYVENLQIVDCRVNVSKDKKNKTSQYTGVSINKNSKKFESRITIKDKNVNLGYFDNEYEAHLAYQKALKMYKEGDLSFIKPKKEAKGVYKSNNKFVAIIWINKKTKCIGTFDNELDAEMAYKEALEMIKKNDFTFLDKKRVYENVKKVINTETNEIYKSASEMCKILGFNYSTMAGKLNGNKKNNTPFRYID
jgi:hypothetical protein